MADAALNRVAVYDAGSGEAVRMLGGQGAAPGLFRAPFGLAVAEGCLVVSESVGARVQVRTLHGLTPTLALTLTLALARCWSSPRWSS